MAINLLEELDRLITMNNRMSGVNVAFFLTYTLNLQFFERLVLPKLERMGASYIGVLADWRAYQASLSDPTRPELCGKSYILNYSPWLRVLQHGKLLWLHGDRDIVFLGSHNLTRSGFNDQLETTVCLDSQDPGQVPAIKAAHGVVSDLVRGADDLSRIWKLVPEPLEGSYQPTVHFLWSGHGDLLHQLIPIIGHAHKIRVVTPFLDASALRELTNLLSAKDVVLDLPSEGADTPLEDALKSVPHLTPRIVDKHHRLHGKAYEFTSDNTQWLAIGSANCTRLGLLNGTKEGGNSEFLALFPGGPLQEEGVEFSVVDNSADSPGSNLCRPSIIGSLRGNRSQRFHHRYGAGDLCLPGYLIRRLNMR